MDKYISLLHKLYISCVCSVTQLHLNLCNPMVCVAHQAPLSMGFSQQKYRSELSFSPYMLLNVYNIFKDVEISEKKFNSFLYHVQETLL